LGLRYVATDMVLGTQKTINRRHEERDHTAEGNTMIYKDLIYSVDERIATITLNRPDRMKSRQKETFIRRRVLML